jgi:hypothetical protein
MREYYEPKHFDVREFVDPETYQKFGQSALLVMDIRILKLADNIRDYFGVPMLINNWHTGGPYRNRGFRRGDALVGAGYSQHKYGRAIDYSLSGYTAEEVRKIIQEHQDEFPFNEICAMELGTSWVHNDVRLTNHSGIFTFYP